jgi:hypothetical protein
MIDLYRSALALPIVLMALGLVAIVVSLVLALIGGVSVDLNAVLGAAVLVVAALALGLTALLFRGE